MTESLLAINAGIDSVKAARNIGLIGFAIFFLTAIRLWTNKENLEPIKAGLDNVKAAGIIGLIVFAIFNPTAIKSWMKETNIKKIGTEGVELFEQADAAVQQSQSANAYNTGQLTLSNGQIKEQLALIGTPETPQAKQTVAAGNALILENEKAIAEANKAMLFAQ